MRHKRRTSLLLGLTALAMAAAPEAEAQDIFFVGNAQGCFGLGCTPGEADAVVLSGVNLTYTSNAVSDFEGVTAGNVLAVNRTGTSTTGTFGSISVGEAAAPTSVSTPFQLLVSFFNPITADPVFDAVISGTVRILGTGGILVDYDPTPGPANVVSLTCWMTTSYSVASRALTDTTTSGSVSSVGVVGSSVDPARFLPTDHPRWPHHWRLTPTEWVPRLGRLLGSKAMMPSGWPNRQAT